MAKVKQVGLGTIGGALKRKPGRPPAQTKNPYIKQLSKAKGK